ncbi:3'-5' exonuclease [Nonomuraea sp. NPDC026600]|uniref:3'-5' exonuclease n=1 Tax=Nonomuraea sp. NPDC026600 TaxID=3155363 RepID=UPI0033FA7CA2
MTDEQHDIVEDGRARKHLVVEAGAGCGKSATARELAKALAGQRILYTAFNKSVIEDAQGTMPANVTCATVHSAAWRAVPQTHRHRLGGPRQPGWRIAKILGITRPLIVGDRKFSPAQIGTIAKEAIIRYCKSDTLGVQDEHIPTPHGLDGSMLARYRTVIRPYIDAYREDIRSPHGEITWTGDVYLKTFQLARLRMANPSLGYGVVILDEAQDVSPVMRSIYVDLQQASGSQIIALGDSAQQINEWNGAINALGQIKADARRTLSQSFRFGQEIADLANIWLAMVGTPLRLKGNPAINSTLGTIAASDADVILTRTNAEAMVHVMHAHKAGQIPMLVKGFKPIKEMAKAAKALQEGRPAEHPELIGFESWGQVQDYADEEADGGDLGTFVKLINEHGADELLEVAEKYRDVTNFDIEISTIHCAKGGQWHTVQIGSDARIPEDGKELGAEEKRLNYVAVTRAQHHLDPGPLGAVAEKPIRHLRSVA